MYYLKVVATEVGSSLWPTWNALIPSDTSNALTPEIKPRNLKKIIPYHESNMIGQESNHATFKKNPYHESNHATFPKRSLP